MSTSNPLRPHKRYSKRKDQVDCFKCEGFASVHTNDNPEFHVIDCPQCLGTGIDPIPWSEIFKLGSLCARTA